jgi:hypothetical protein
MNCIDFLAVHARCKRGIPVARLFRHYFCEGDHNGCPLKKREKLRRGLLRGHRTGNFSIVGSGS